MRKVMVFGCFDPLHEGHRSLFRQAKRHGDALVVVVARDSSIRRIKKREPRLNEEERRASVEREPLVDKAVLGRKDDFFDVIRTELPDVIVLGYDQQTFTEEQIWDALGDDSVEILRAVALDPQKYKSSKI
ncbi:FAD synthase [Candidatus Woesearchaeota archaeon]|nr:MAG: FAD synthase [Candidatus Woesearchaeota archaeon]